MNHLPLCGPDRHSTTPWQKRRSLNEPTMSGFDGIKTQTQANTGTNTLMAKVAIKTTDRTPILRSLHDIQPLGSRDSSGNWECHTHGTPGTPGHSRHSRALQVLVSRVTLTMCDSGDKYPHPECSGVLWSAWSALECPGVP
jgi:hypothetical protein